MKQDTRRLIFYVANILIGLMMILSGSFSVLSLIGPGPTDVRMEQSGFGPDEDQAYQDATHGWQKFFAKLDCQRLCENSVMDHVAPAFRRASA